MIKDLMKVMDWMLSTHTVPPPDIQGAVERLRTVHQEPEKEYAISEEDVGISKETFPSAKIDETAKVDATAG